MGLFAKLREGLTKTRDSLMGRVDTLVKETRKIDEDFYEELEDILLMSDCGMKATTAIMDELRRRVSENKVKDADTAKQMLKDIMIEQMDIPRPPLRWPMVMLVVGVNGAGKTTTIGKLALRFQNIGRRIILCAADTFRAAAVFSKFEDDLRPDKPHIVLHHPSDSGNVGTIFRTALGFDVQDIAVIRPCVDVFDPKTVRASMGSIFQLRLHVYDDFSQYQAQFPEHALYPFMLDGSKSLPDVLGDIPDRWTLIFGNEGSGLPPEFIRLGQPVRIPSSNKVDSLNLSIAAAIGIYAFARR